MAALKDLLDARTRRGDLYQRIDDRRIRCVACGHRCPIPDGAVGVCKVRGNRGGELYVPWGYVGGVQCDPIEKKPFFHAMPGALAYSFGMLGCDLHCGYCQNWVSSQALRDPRAVAPPRVVDPASLVADALEPQGLELVDLEEPQECCGFGGTFAVKNADTSMAMLSDKLRRILDTRAEVCTAADNSCLMHIGGALRRQRTGVRAMHLAEILASTG